jgi:hypothetical protein
MRWRGWSLAAVASVLALGQGCAGKSSDSGGAGAPSSAGGGAGAGTGGSGGAVVAPVGGSAAGSMTVSGGVGGCPAPDACVGGTCATGIIGGTQGLGGGSPEGGGPIQVTYIDCSAYEDCGLMTGCTNRDNGCVSVPGCRGSICTSGALLCEACSGECLSQDSYPPQLSCSTGDIMGFEPAAGAAGQSARIALPCR